MHFKECYEQAVVHVLTTFSAYYVKLIFRKLFLTNLMFLFVSVLIKTATGLCHHAYNSLSADLTEMTKSIRLICFLTKCLFNESSIVNVVSSSTPQHVCIAAYIV